MEKLSLEVLDRLQGLTNQKCISNIRSNYNTVIEDLIEEGFSTKEVEIYVKIVIEAQISQEIHDYFRKAKRRDNLRSQIDLLDKELKKLAERRLDLTDSLNCL